MKKILIISNDAELRRELREILSTTYQLVKFSTGKEGLTQAIALRPDLVVIEQGIPDMSGLAVCERFRLLPETRTLPLIFICDDPGLDSRIRGLELGADDSICRPIDAGELLARIRARLRRVELERREISLMNVGNLKINPLAYEAFVDDRPVRLTQIEFELLRYFVDRPNRVIQRNRVLRDLWPDTIVTDRTVDTHIAHLRRKLQGFNCLFTTVYKVGYMLKVEC